MKAKLAPQCRRCRVRMRRGVALRCLPTGSPDFPGDTGDETWCTVSNTGPAVQVPCWKCPRCGHSLEIARAARP